MTKKIIVWDLGGTKCTAGIIEQAGDAYDLICRKRFTIKLKETVSLEDLIQKIETGLDFPMSQADAICIGGAGHYDGRVLTHANPYPYPLPFFEIAKLLKWPPFAVIHDYASIVCSTFTSYMQESHNVKILNHCEMNKEGRRVALGLGTGLGLKDGVLFPDGNFWLGQNEAGHVGIINPPKVRTEQFKKHAEIMRYLTTLFADTDAITFEKILTGQGLVNLHQFFYPQESNITPEAISEKIHKNKVPELVDMFAWYIGLFIGTVQLFFLPDGGVWITGGVIMNNLTVLDNPNLLEGINASPAYLSQRNEYPLGILSSPDHALIGCGYYAAKRLLT